MAIEAETQSTDSYIRIMEWVHARRKQLIIAGAVIVLVAIVIGFMTWKKNQDDTDANARFFSVPTQRMMGTAPLPTSTLLEVAKEYPSTPGGANARLLAAEALFTQGQYPEAYQQFSDFLGSYPDSPLVSQAKVGEAASLEGEGKLEDAISKYHEIVLSYPNDLNIVSPAKLTLARLYEEDNKPQDALGYYSELARMLRQNPYDPWASEAEERATLLVAKHPELLKVLQNQAAAANGPASVSVPQTAQPAPRPQPSSTPPSSAQPGQPKNVNLLNLGTSTNSTGKH